MSKKSGIDMTSGNPAKLMIQFAVPMILGNIFQQVYSMVDSIIVGRFVGKNALAAIGATQSVLFLIVCLIIGLTMGTCILVSQFFGAKNYKAIKDIAGSAIYVCIGAWLLICVISSIFAGPILRLLNTPDEIFVDAKAYLLVNNLCSIAPITYNMFANIMRALGDSKTPLYALIVSSATNVVLDLIFVLIFHWGVVGAGVATVIAQILSSLFCLWVVIRKHPVLHITRENLHFNPRMFGQIIRIGIPMAIQNGVASVGMMIVQSMINQYGTDTVAAYTAANKIDQIALMPLQSLGSSVSTYVGQNYGSGNLKRIKKGVVMASVIGCITGLALMGIILILAGPLVTLFVSAKEVGVIVIAKEYLRTVTMFYWLCALMNIFLSLYRGMGKMLISTISSIMEPLTKVIAAVVLGTLLGREGIWCSWPVGWLFALSIPVILFVSGRAFEGMPVSDTEF